MNGAFFALCVACIKVKRKTSVESTKTRNQRSAFSLLLCSREDSKENMKYNSRKESPQ